MPRKIRQLKADLRRAGFLDRGGRSGHTNWTHPLLPGLRLTLAGNDGDDARQYNERELAAILAALTQETARRQEEEQGR